MEDRFIRVCGTIIQSQTEEVPKSSFDDPNDFLLDFIQNNIHNEKGKEISPVFIEDRICIYKRTDDRFVILEDRKSKIRVVVIEVKNKNINLATTRFLNINKDIIFSQKDVLHILTEGKFPELI